MSRPVLYTAYHLHSVFDPDRARHRAQQAAEILRPVAPDVLVVTGLSGTLLGVRVAELLGCKLTVVRRDNEIGVTQSGGARIVEGWLGGRYVFFDDIVASGNTRQRARNHFEEQSRAYGATFQYLGTYLHGDTRFWPAPSPRED